MKKIILALVVIASMLVSCATPTVNQVPIYGEIEDCVFLNGYHHYKVWSPKKEKYYTVISNQLYQLGETIRIK